MFLACSENFGQSPPQNSLSDTSKGSCTEQSLQRTVLIIIVISRHKKMKFKRLRIEITLICEHVVFLSVLHVSCRYMSLLYADLSVYNTRVYYMNDVSLQHKPSCLTHVTADFTAARPFESRLTVA